MSDNSQISAVDSDSGLLTGKISDEIDRKSIRGERISKYEMDEFKQLNTPEKIAMTIHAKSRMEERGVNVDDVLHCIDSGEIIEQYEDDKPLPSCLVLGKNTEGMGLHIVVSKDEEYIYLITAYYPDEERWEADLKTRRER